MRRALSALVLLSVTLVFSLVLGLATISSADAARRHKKVRHTVVRPSPMYAVPANRPPWAAPQQCYTNDGYGRYLPCDLGDGR